MKKAILTILLFAVLFSGLGFAQTVTDSYITTPNTYQNGVVSTCIGNNTIMNSLTVLRCVDNQCSTIVANATHACQYGCNAKNNPNMCNPAPFQVNIMLLGIVILVILFLIGFFAWKSGH